MRGNGRRQANIIVPAQRILKIRPRNGRWGDGKGWTKMTFYVSYLSCLRDSHSSQGLRWQQDLSPRQHNWARHCYSIPIHQHWGSEPCGAEDGVGWDRKALEFSWSDAVCWNDWLIPLPSITELTLLFDKPHSSPLGNSSLTLLANFKANNVISTACADSGRHNELNYKVCCVNCVKATVKGRLILVGGLVPAQD